MVMFTGRERVTPLDVPVIVSVAFVGGAAPPPQPLKANDATNTARPTSAATRMIRLLAKSLRANSNEAARQSSASALKEARKPGITGTRTNGMLKALEVLDTLTTKPAPLVPLTVRLAGDTEQVADLGAPAQVRATVPLKPLLGAICRL